MKTVLFLSCYFPPMGGPGVQRIAKLVKYLPSFGYLKEMAYLSNIRGIEIKIISLISIGYNTESLKLALQEIRK